MKKRKHNLKDFNLHLKNQKNKTRVKGNSASQEKKLSVYHYKIGRNNIKLTVEKIQVLNKSDLVDAIFYYSCSFCKKDFAADVTVCPDCQHELVRVNLKKCPKCGAKNNPALAACWVCSQAFPKVEQKLETQEELLLTLAINNHIYRKTDQGLSSGIKKLFVDLIAANFSQEPLEAWIKIYEQGIENKKEILTEEYRYLVEGHKKRSLLHIVEIIVAIAICLLIIVVFWLK